MAIPKTSTRTSSRAPASGEEGVSEPLLEAGGEESDILDAPGAPTPPALGASPATAPSPVAVASAPSPSAPKAAPEAAKASETAKAPEAAPAAAPSRKGGETKVAAAPPAPPPKGVARYRVWPHGGFKHKGKIYRPGEQLSLHEDEAAKFEALQCVNPT